LRSAIALLIVGTVIANLGAIAVVVYFFRRRSYERFLLWFGLFSIFYGTVLVVRDPIFRLAFGQPSGATLSIERIASLSVIVPGLLLFEEIYGRGWHSSVRWVIGFYCVLAAAAIAAEAYMGHPEGRPEMILPPGSVVALMIPIALVVGYFAGYRPLPVENKKVLFFGLLAFYCAFSLDQLRMVQIQHYISQFEPYGFLILAVCLWFTFGQRAIADESRLVSLTDEMRAATKIQESILPAAVPSLENIQIAVRYAPMTAVAGDLYSFPRVGPNSIGVLMADVIGHGVSGALVASMVKVAVSMQGGLDGEPSKVIAGLNTILCNEACGQYVTAVYLHLDTAKGIGRCSAAAHPAPLLWRSRRQTLEALGEAGLLLGVRPDEAFAESEFSFEPGDRILVYTDGLSEAENAAGDSFGEVALPALIRKSQNLDAEHFLDLLLEEVLIWSRDGIRRQQEDDITMLTIDIHDGWVPHS
jgi:sigma-B regulation protein RsbU (phosphoserine phosphatase)